MAYIIPFLVAAVFIGIGLFLLLWGKVTLKPDRRKVMDSHGHIRSSFSLRVTRGIGLVFILGGILTILGAFHLFDSILNY
ncbi:hypothetical protein [Rhizorhapis sp. SPR117]|uniref:hypothetical protein n=1 Tax=Rhizorhapis sp. SPR117 TaxID=2912611 RepID=UPI001F2B52BC|nr:hypothetical protein [Rhizorhapis sp. SPR117]